MQVPLLSTAFCGCTLETGAKVIAWIQLVFQMIGFLIILLVLLGFGAAVSEAAKENNQNPFMKNNNNDLDLSGFGQRSEVFPSIMNDNNQSQTMKDNDDEILAVFIGVGVALIIFIFALFLIHFIATIMLLIGINKKRPGYMVFWLVLAVLSLIISLLSIRLKGIIFFVINLYFTWVVYSHYRQLRDSSDPLATHRAHGDLKLQGDVPVPNAPPAYAFNQKQQF